MAETPKDVLALAKDSGAQIVDLRFCDLPGIMQHFSMPVSELTEDGFVNGYGFDGSSIRGFQAIHETDMRFSPLLAMADKVMIYKYVVKSVAWAHGRTATFMPKPLFGDNGSGMHVHSSLWKEGEPLFSDPVGYAGLSDMGRHYIGGLLAHAPALLAFCAPTTNSYRRLVPGFEAPINLVYSQRNRSACVRVPMYSTNPKAKRVEFRCPDPSANPYLAFSAMLQAGLDGILNKIEPPDPIDKDLYDLEPEEAAAVG